MGLNQRWFFCARSFLLIGSTLASLALVRVPAAWAEAPTGDDANNKASAPNGRSFFVDPEKGSPQGNGSAAHPWHTLAEVLRAGLIQTKDASGRLQHAGAPVHAGDTILLRSGYHGEVKLAGAYNDEVITVAAEKGHTPKLGSLEVNHAARWTFRGLTISPSFVEKPYTGSKVQNNLAFSFNFKADKDVVAENNKPVTKETYERRRQELEVLLATKFGRQHPTSNRKRVDAQPAAEAK